MLFRSVDNLKDQAIDVKDYIVDKSVKLKNKALDTGEYVDDYVRENPWKAVGIGVVAGLVISKLLDALRK